MPYTFIERAGPERFIESEYLPGGMVFKDPGDMTREHLVTFLQRISDRQGEHGPAMAFRFSHYEKKVGRDSNIHKARYPAACGDKRTDKAFKKRKPKGPRHAGRVDLPDSVAVATTPAPALMVSTPPPADFTSESGPWITVDDGDLVILTDHGFTIPQAINGPQDGQPRYRVPGAAQAILDKEQERIIRGAGDAGLRQKEIDDGMEAYCDNLSRIAAQEIFGKVLGAGSGQLVAWLLDNCTVDGAPFIGEYQRKKWWFCRMWLARQTAGNAGVSMLPGMTPPAGPGTAYGIDPYLLGALTIDRFQSCRNSST